MSYIEVEVQATARHVHLKEEDFKALFGEDAELTLKKDLGAGMFQAEEKVGIKGPKGEFERVSILGPLRSYTQVEVSMTDARKLGVDPPIRMSGDLEGSEKCILTGPLGEREIEECVIVSKRHIHLTPEDAEKLGVGSGEAVCLRIEGERALVFDEVMTRVDDINDQSEIHLDTDEINAAKLPSYSMGKVYKRDEIINI